MRDADAGAEARWSRAAARSDGLADLGIGDAVSRYFLVIFPPTVLVALGIGFALAFFWPQIYGDVIPTGLSIGLMLAGLGIFIVGLN